MGRCPGHEPSVADVSKSCATLHLTAVCGRSCPFIETRIELTRRQAAEFLRYLFCTCTQLFRRFTRFQTSNSFAFSGIRANGMFKSSLPTITKAFKQKRCYSISFFVFL